MHAGSRLEERITGETGYRYTHQLAQLEQCRGQMPVPEQLRRVESPLVASQWASLLESVMTVSLFSWR